MLGGRCGYGQQLTLSERKCASNYWQNLELDNAQTCGFVHAAIGITNVLKEKGIQNYQWILSNSIWKTAHFDPNCMKIGFYFFKILRFYVFKMAASVKLTLKLKIIKLSLFIKSMHTHVQFTNMIFVYSHGKQSFYGVRLLWILYFY